MLLYWDGNDYVTEVEKELFNIDINKQVSFKEKTLCKLAEILGTCMV